MIRYWRADDALIMRWWCTDDALMMHWGCADDAWVSYLISLNSQLLWKYRMWWVLWVLCLCNCLCLCLFIGQAMSPHHSDQMSQRSQVSSVTLWRRSLNVFVFVIVFVFASVFVIVFFLVSSCLLITLIKCLKSRKSLGSLFEGAL